MKVTEETIANLGSFLKEQLEADIVSLLAAKLHLSPILQLAETAESFILPTKTYQLNAQSENFLGNTHVNVRTAHTASPPAILSYNSPSISSSSRFVPLMIRTST